MIRQSGIDFPYNMRIIFLENPMVGCLTAKGQSLDLDTVIQSIKQYIKFKYKTMRFASKGWDAV